MPVFMVMFGIFLGLTILVLAAGLVLMAVGGKTNKKFSNYLMSARVIFQALAIATLAISALLYGHP